MHLIENGLRLNTETPFRHGLLIGGAMADDRYILRIDIADPIGVPVTVPNTTRTITFDRPSIGMMLVRKDDRALSCLMPLELVFHMQAEMATLTACVRTAWLDKGADPIAVARNIRALVSAFNGVIHRPDRFGVEHWAPSLSMPFGLVMAGQWLGTPEVADPMTYTVKEAAQ